MTQLEAIEDLLLNALSEIREMKKKPVVKVKTNNRYHVRERIKKSQFTHKTIKS